MTTAVLAKTETAVERPPDNMAEVIYRASKDATVDIDKLERLLAMKERMDAIGREAAFRDALSRVQPLIPQMQKNGRIMVGQTERSRYARLEDIDRIIRPIYAKEGFALSFTTDSADGKTYRITGRLSHRAGYFEEKLVVLPIDIVEGKNGPIRSGVQSVGSTVSYGRRMLTKLFFNIIETEEDDDGAGAGAEPITQDEADTLRDSITEVGGNMNGFLKLMGVARLEDIPKRDVKRAWAAIEEKRRGAR